MKFKNRISKIENKNSWCGEEKKFNNNRWEITMQIRPTKEYWH